ncbi:MAG: N-6 DNA methylase [bacterium]
MKNIQNIVKRLQNIMRKDPGVNGDAQRIEQLGWMFFLKILDDKELAKETFDDNYRPIIPKELQWRNWAADEEGITGEALEQFINNKLFPELMNLDITSDPRAAMVRDIFADNNNYMKNGTTIRQVINEINRIDFNRSQDRHLFGDIYEKILKDLQSAGHAGEFYTPRALTDFMAEMMDPKPEETVFDPACGTGGFLISALEHIRDKYLEQPEQLKQLERTLSGQEFKPLPYLLANTNLILHDIEVPRIFYADSLAREYTSIKKKDQVDVILANPPFGASVSDGAEKNFPMNFRTTESADLFVVLMIRYLKEGGRAAIVLPDGSLTGEGVKQRIRQHLLETCNLHTIVRLPNSVFQPYASVATNLLFFEKGKPTREVWYYEHKLPEGQKSYSKTKPIRLEEFDPVRQWWNNREENEVAWKVPVEEIKENGWDLDVKNPNKPEEEQFYSADELVRKLKDSFNHCQEILKEFD